MALVKKEDDKEEEKLQIADEDSVPNEGTPGEETQLGGDDAGGKDLKENEDAGGEDEVDGEDNCRTIPILVAILKVVFLNLEGLYRLCLLPNPIMLYIIKCVEIREKNLNSARQVY